MKIKHSLSYSHHVYLHTWVCLLIQVLGKSQITKITVFILAIERIQELQFINTLISKPLCLKMILLLQVNKLPATI